ncbi:MAG: radical SAM family heme chaperone HemW [Gemmatimonadaceae bacterium]
MNAEHLYIHVPFCTRRCVYCDFSIAVRASVPVREFVAAVGNEWDCRHRESRFDLATLYFGGGTPSKLGGDGVARLMDVVRQRATIRADAEITLEVNPEDVTPDAVTMWRSAGINRLSLGIQSFDPGLLAWMHRTHDADAAHRAIAVARDAGMDDISIDLIFATPAALRRSWLADLDAAVRLNLPHVSIYGLTVEPRTPLGRLVARNDIAEAAEETFEEEFLMADARFTAAGWQHYEVSNYGKPGHHSRHNWSYWQRRPYGGLGPSAHEFDGRQRRWNVAPYAEWSERTTTGMSSTAGSEDLDEAQVSAEQIYLGLRTNTGVALSPSERDHVASWIRSGWATVSDDSLLRLSATGWLRLDALAGDLTHLRSR